MTNKSKRALGEWLWLAWCVIAVVILLAFVSDANGQENYIRQCSNQYACTLTPVGGTSWSAPVQTYLWTPLSPDVSLRILVHNQNTTNAHTAQTLTLWITGSTRADVSLIGQSDIWVQAAVIQNSTANAKCTAVAANNATTPGASGTGTCYAQGMYAAQMALQFTPGGAQAGTVDNFDISIVQCTSAHCNYPGGPQPGNDSSAGAGPSNSVNLSQSAGVAVPATGADAVVNTAQPFPTGNYVFNGTTWDRARSGASGYTTQVTTGVALNRPKELSAYAATTAPTAPVATPTDYMEMCGNGTTTVQITRWEVGFTATAAPAANMTATWIKRSTADTGGGASVLVIATYDSSDPGPISGPRVFTSNPALGATPQAIKLLNITPDNILSNSDPQNIYTYVQSPGAKPWTLRGAAQCIYLNLGGATLPAGFAVTSTIEWIERTDI